MTTEVQPRSAAGCVGTGDDVCERPGPTARRGTWAIGAGARKSVNFPSDVAEDLLLLVDNHVLRGTVMSDHNRHHTGRNIRVSQNRSMIRTLFRQGDLQTLADS